MNDREAAFIERLAAAATHEIMNGLASIGQATGLMSDLLTLGLGGEKGGLLGYLGLGRKKGRANNTVKFKKSIANIRSGMKKSLETTKALNRFIHSLTPSNESFKAEDILDVLTVLMRRAARQRKVDLQMGFCDPSLTVQVPQLSLYRALVTCLDELLGQAEAGGVIEMSCRSESDQAEFSITSSEYKHSGDNLNKLKEIMQNTAKNTFCLRSIEQGYALSFPIHHS